MGPACARVGGKQGIAGWALLLQATAAAATALLLLYSSAPLWQAPPAGQPTQSRTAAAPSDAAPQLLYVLRGSNASDGLLAAFRKLQRELGAERTFLLFDDTRAAWPHGKTVRASSPRRPGSPNVVLFNESEGVAVMRGVEEEMQVRWLALAAWLYVNRVNPRCLHLGALDNVRWCTWHQHPADKEQSCHCPKR